MRLLEDLLLGFHG